MGIKQQLRDEIERLQSKLDSLEQYPDDNFAVGDVLKVVTKRHPWFIEKRAADQWTRMGNTRTLDEWLVNIEETCMDGFKIYLMKEVKEPWYEFGELN